MHNKYDIKINIKSANWKLEKIYNKNDNKIKYINNNKVLTWLITNRK